MTFKYLRNWNFMRINRLLLTRSVSCVTERTFYWIFVYKGTEIYLKMQIWIPQGRNLYRRKMQLMDYIFENRISLWFSIFKRCDGKMKYTKEKLYSKLELTVTNVMLFFILMYYTEKECTSELLDVSSKISYIFSIHMRSNAWNVEISNSPA